MSLARDVSRRVATGRRSLDAPLMQATAWICCGIFMGSYGVMLLLSRLGVGLGTTTGLMIALLVAFVLLLTWRGRTMTGSLFFYAGRLPGAACVGVSATADWLSGTLLVGLLALAAVDRLALVFAVPVALVVQGVALAPVMQRAGVVTVPGLLAWRTGTQRTGLLALIVLLPMLGLLAVAETRVLVALLHHLSGLNVRSICAIVLVLAVLPSLGGGWLALVFVNLVLGTCAIVGLALPALLNAFVAPELLPQAAPTPVALLPDIAGVTFGVSPVLTCIVAIAGLAAMPVALSRAPLTVHPTAAMQSASFTALTVFLAMAALPLSLLLLSGSAGPNEVAARPMLGILAVIGLMLAAFNHLSACLFMAATSLVRAMRRTQRRDPSERSMASIRMLVIAFALLCHTALLLYPTRALQDNLPLLLLAMSLSAGGFFIPLMAAGWISGLSWISYSTAMVLGAVAVAITAGLGNYSVAAVLQGGAVGLAVSLVCVMVGRFAPIVRKRTPIDTRLASLRIPEGT